MENSKSSSEYDQIPKNLPSLPSLENTLWLVILVLASLGALGYVWSAAHPEETINFFIGTKDYIRENTRVYFE